MEEDHNMKVVVRNIKPDVNNSGPVCRGSDVDLEGGFIQSVPFQYHHHHHDRFAQPESTFSSSSSSSCWVVQSVHFVDPRMIKGLY